MMVGAHQLLFIPFLAHATGTYAAPQAGVAAYVKLAARQGPPPASFEPQTKAGPGGTNVVDSARFSLFDWPEAYRQETTAALEGAYNCFVDVFRFRSPALSIAQPTDDGPYYRTNVYAKPDVSLDGLMGYDTASGFAWVEVRNTSIPDITKTLNVYSRVLMYHQRTWVSKRRTTAWGQLLTVWFPETYLTSSICKASRELVQQKEGRTNFDVHKIIGNSYQSLIDATEGTGNHYQAWPFITYLSNNPDGIGSVSKQTVVELFKSYRDHEDPFVTLDRAVQGAATAIDLVSLYWARMAYVDIGHDQAQQVFFEAKARNAINFANVDVVEGGYKVKPGRAPVYLGANIIPLQKGPTHYKGDTVIEVDLKAKGTYQAFLSMKAPGRPLRWVQVRNNTATAAVKNDEEISLVVVNAPEKLLDYDPTKIKGTDAGKWLDYAFTLTGATVVHV
ncbi:hypothetical protein CTA2_1605 [Colletotrichum tanaceti]|uniref:Uncharacterized protein n=1 Tax=Colletotrichum tanaceti TaxID=1306861 RepID=A0A4V6DI96_9PEZI|nr:hypothetical protein CTA2_1605 [Colletotrichum tanaceti]TKW58336.1 hypothetical protein CTA1_5230 [Colletotrichum tanaceti]